jgi:hypothetical protein
MEDGCGKKLGDLLPVIRQCRETDIYVFCDLGDIIHVVINKQKLRFQITNETVMLKVLTPWRTHLLLRSDVVPVMG